MFGLSGAFISAGAEPSANTVNQQVDELISQMTLHDKICQLFIMKPEDVAGVKIATKATKATRNGLTKYPVGGIVYFSDNIVNEDQVKALISNSQSFAMDKLGIGLFIAVDEEGGTIARVAEKLNTTRFEPMGVIGLRGDEKEAYAMGAAIAQDIARLGFNLNFAPVADVIIDQANTEIGSRSFGTDPELVSKMVIQVVKGLQENGVMATLKHFPGHGSTTADSHKGTSVTIRTLEEMEQVEFLPFIAGMNAGADMVMISHLTAASIDETSPASISKTIITGILREKLGFEGIVITDALMMKAISDLYPPEEAAVRALEAGADMLLMPVSLPDAVKGIKTALDSGRLTQERIDQSVRRILFAKCKYGLITP
jgi:beta-N-acetylhexosaminidase